MPLQRSTGTEGLEDVAIRLQRATINRYTGVWAAAGPMLDLVVDGFDINRGTESMRTDPGQSSRVGKRVTKCDWKVNVTIKAQIDDWDVEHLIYEIESAGGGYWREWLVYVFKGGSWNPYGGELMGYDQKGDNPCITTLNFEPGPQDD